jgi:hypothetical protein
VLHRAHVKFSSVSSSEGALQKETDQTSVTTSHSDVLAQAQSTEIAGGEVFKVQLVRGGCVFVCVCVCVCVCMCVCVCVCVCVCLCVITVGEW